MTAKTVARKIGWGMTFACGLSTLYLVFLAVRPDDALSPQAGRFFGDHTERIAEDRDANVGLIGLSAPKDADPLTWAKSVRKAYRDSESGELDNTQLASLGERLVAGNVSAIECLLESSIPQNSKEWCATPEQHAEIFRENVLLARLKQIQQLPAVGDNTQYWAQAAISAAKLAHAEVVFDIREGRSEEAYQKWLAQQKFVNVLCAGGESWVGIAIKLVMERLSLDALDELGHSGPHLLERHRDEVAAALQPMAMIRYQPARILRSEFYLLNRAVSSGSYYGLQNKTLTWGILLLFARPNVIQNEYTKFADAFEFDMVSEPVLSAGGLRNHVANHKHAGVNFATIFDPITVMYLDYVLLSPHVGLVQSMHEKNARRRMHLLRLQLLEEKVADGEIGAFLEKSAPNLRSPFDGKPMRWDPVKRSLYAPVAGETWRPEVRL